jgi:hypothetical protein
MILEIYKWIEKIIAIKNLKIKDLNSNYQIKI